uniref:Uncharacterized protein n=1 Tax=Arundo donax TaxID=35708 RepID=A0A0A9C614_ARUDO
MICGVIKFFTHRLVQADNNLLSS